jgi:Capsule polysaccharide biosynthesis protein
MRFLFVTLQHRESDFYGRVGRNLNRRGHEVAQLTYSRRSARMLRRNGAAQADCLPDLMRETPLARPWNEEEDRIVDQYPIDGLRDVYRTDPPFRRGDGVDECAERTVRQFVAIEALVDRFRPDIVVPEVGNESIRTIAELVGTDRGATTLFLMYTIFDDPLRLYAGTMDAPIVPPEELRELSDSEEAELDDFIARYRRRNQPIREHRTTPLGGDRPRTAARHYAVKAIWDRDNVYLTPTSWLSRDLRARARLPAVRRLYSEKLPERGFVYFPLQVADDYKILRLRPHCADQEAIVDQVIRALPAGADLVVKEHPMSIGRNPVHRLARMAAPPNVHLAEPHTSTLELIERALAVVTISSTVGLEAVMLGKPVMTLGRPFYSGYGITVDIEDRAELPERMPGLLAFEPDLERTRRFLHAAKRHCYPGAPVLVDSSDENAMHLATTLDRAASGELDDRRFPHGDA